MKSKLYILTGLLFFLMTGYKSFSQANTSLSNLASVTAVNHSLIAGTTNYLSLGSSTIGWRNIYLTNGVYFNGNLSFSTPLNQNTFAGYLSGNLGVRGNYNSVLGAQALKSVTTGASNIASGFEALYTNTTGSNNVANGTKALFSNTTGYSNIAFGIKALYSNTTGNQNIAIGDSALYNYNYNLGIGNGNMAIGSKALYNNTSGYDNVALGQQALFSNTSGDNNTVTGQFTLYSNTSGDYNTADGTSALYSNTTGNENTAIGYRAAYFTTTGYSNVAVGSRALFNCKAANNLVAIGDSALFFQTSNLNGLYDNTAVGSKALYANSNGYYLTATGYKALFSNTSGSNNTADGVDALYDNVTGSDNTAVGLFALSLNNSGNDNTCIGYAAYPSDGTISNYTGIGSAVGSSASASNMVEIGNDNITVIRGAVNFSTYSDERIKNNIKNNVPGLAFINLLKPVTYNIDLAKQSAIIYKGDKRKDSINKIDYLSKTDIEKQLKTGFIAQEVDAAAKKLNYDFSGVVKPQNANDLYSLRYAEFVIPLVKAVQELSKQNDSLKTAYDQKFNAQQKEIDELKAMIISSTTQLTVVSSASLAQNIPNPFVNSTTINYSLPQTYSSARIIITDKKGVVLKQTSLTAGKGTLSVDASTLAAGAYQYSLYINGRLIDTKQMVLTK